MNTTLLGTVAVIYLWVGINYYLQSRYGMCFAFAAYAMANIGFMMDGWGQ